MPKRILFLAIAAVLIGLSLLLNSVISAKPLVDFFGRRELSELHRTFEQAVAAELPAGSAIADVEAFLAGYDEVSGYELEYDTHPASKISSILQEKRPELQTKVEFETTAAIYDVFDIAIVRAGLFLTFFYDEQGRLLFADIDTGSTSF